MRLVTLSLVDLLARPGRLVLTVAGLVIAIAAFVALDGIVRGFERALTETVAATGTHIHVTEKGSIDFLSSLVPEELAPRLRDAPGVEAVSPVLVRLVPVKGGLTVPVLGWPQAAYLWRTIALVDGRLPQAGTGLEVALGKELASRLGLGPGDKLDLLGLEATVVGRVDTRSQLNRASIFALLNELQEATMRRGQVTSINVRLQPAALADLARSVSLVAQRAEGFQVVDSDSLARDNFVLLLTRALSRSIFMIALVLTFVGILTNLWNLVRERRHEFAVLRAIGWPLSRIGMFMLVQAWTMCLLAAAMGVFLGVAGTRWVSRLPAIGTYIEPELSQSVLLWAGGGVLFAGLLAVALPLWLIARTDPASILRSP